jgi:hypothetical protein
MTTELALQNSTNIALAEPSDDAIGRLMRQADAMGAARKIGNALAGTAMVPEIYQQYPENKKENPQAADNAAAAILYGAELGLSAVQSLQNIFIVRGKPAVYSRTMVAQVLVAGHRVEEVEATPTSVTWRGVRRDTGAEFVSTWTIERAKVAGFLSNKLYASIPTEMLRAKCQSEVCRTMAPDVLLGMAFSREDLELEAPPVKVRSERVRTGAAGLRDALGVKDDESVAEAAAADAGPTLISPAQLTKLHAMFSNVGLTNRDEALAWLSNILERDIQSSKDIEAGEVDRIFAELETEQP